MLLLLSLGDVDDDDDDDDDVDDDDGVVDSVALLISCMTKFAASGNIPSSILSSN